MRRLADLILRTDQVGPPGKTPYLNTELETGYVPVLSTAYPIWHRARARWESVGKASVDALGEDGKSALNLPADASHIGCVVPVRGTWRRKEVLYVGVFE